MCTGAADDTSLVCSPTKAHLTVFVGLATSTEVIEESKNHLLSAIQHGMNSGRYTSDAVERVIFASALSDEVDLPSKQVNDVQAQVSSQSTDPPEDAEFPVSAIVAAMISILVLVIGIYLMKRNKRRSVAPYKARRKSVVSFAPSLEEEIPVSSCHSSSVASSRDDKSNSDDIDEKSKPRLDESVDESERMSDSGAGSDMILQWVFKKDKFASNF